MHDVRQLLWHGNLPKIVTNDDGQYEIVLKLDGNYTEYVSAERILEYWTDQVLGLHQKHGWRAHNPLLNWWKGRS